MQKPAGTGWKHVEDGGVEHVELVQQRLSAATAEMARVLIEQKRIARAQGRGAPPGPDVGERMAECVRALARAETVEQFMAAQREAREVLTVLDLQRGVR